MPRRRRQPATVPLPEPAPPIPVLTITLPPSDRTQQIVIECQGPDEVVKRLTVRFEKVEPRE